MISWSKFPIDTSFHYSYRPDMSDTYRVTVAGDEVPVYACRVSAAPFNRVWPGHQRPYDQTKAASYVNIVADEAVTLSVTAKKPHERILIKPYSAGITAKEEGGVITFTLTDEGGYVLALDDDTDFLYVFLNRPVPAPDKASVTYYFGPGIHMPRKIELHDNESVYVDKDALVFSSVYAENAKNIRIFGNGVFDDSGEARFAEECYENYTVGNLRLYDCENVSVEGVLFKNSAIWCLAIFHCTNVSLDRVRVFGQWRYNTDGVDIVNSRDVTVRRSFLHSFDDTVSIKGIDRYMEYNNENILIEGCELWCDWGKTCEIGIETSCRTYRNIVFRDCDILRAGNTALDIQSGDIADLGNIRFEDIRVEYERFHTKEQLQQNEEMVYTCGGEHNSAFLLKISNHRFHWGEHTSPPDLDMTGLEYAGVHDVTVRNVTVYYDEAIPRVDGRPDVPVDIQSRFDGGARYHDIAVEAVTVNGKPMGQDDLPAVIADTDRFTWK